MRVMNAVLFVLLALGAVANAATNDSGMKAAEYGDAAGDVSQAKAIFAGGCFWCMEPAFEKLPGVVSVISGYTGGQKENPTYQEVSAGGTGHAEAVEVVYDPAETSFAQLLESFFMCVAAPAPSGGML